MQRRPWTFRKKSQIFLLWFLENISNCWILGFRLTLAFAVRWTQSNWFSIQDIRISFRKEMGLKREQFKHQTESTTDCGSSLTFTLTMCPLAHLTLSSMPSLCSSDAQMTFPWWRRKASRSSRVKNTSLKSLERKWQQKTSEHFLGWRDSARSQTKTTHSLLSTQGTQWTTVGLSVAWGKQRRQLDVCLGTYLRLIQHVGYLPENIFQIFQII